MAEPREIVEAYFKAIGERDLEVARTFLRDSCFSYTSPIGSFDDADRFIDSLFGVGPIIEKVTIRKLFEMGNEVMVIVDTLTTLGGYTTYVTAILLRIEDQKIAAMEAIFDASLYKERFIEQFDTGEGA